MKYTNKDLFRTEDGKIVNCSKNYYILGYWGTVWLFTKKWVTFDDGNNMIISLKEAANSLYDALFILGTISFFIIAFPVMPLVRGYFSYRVAKKECEAWIQSGRKL
jgi:hypothetical protein